MLNNDERGFVRDLVCYIFDAYTSIWETRMSKQEEIDTNHVMKNSYSL